MANSRWEIIGPSIIGGIIGSLSYSAVSNMYKEKKLEKNYVKPSSIEIELKDTNKNDGLETIVEIEGNKYRLMYNDLGEPVFRGY